jgi:colicin import membrane protein
MTLTNSQRTGLITTIVFHTVVLLLLLYMGFVAPYPPPQEEGFLVDFGNSDTGLGIEEPSAASAPDVAEVSTPEVKTPVKKVVAVAKPVNRPPKASRVDNQGEEDILTQDYEKTVAIAARAKKKLSDEKKAKLDEEKQQRAEALEIQRQEAEENRIQQERTKKIGAINSRAKNAFGGGKTDNGSQSTGQGNTYGSGNQGSPDGTPGVNQYGLGGGAGKGISFSLSGRNARSLPKPAFPGNESGIVVVEVTVDKYGKVNKALPGVKGSNTVNPDLLEAAKKAALAASFNTDENAPAFQKGTITYHFILE